MNTSHRLLLIGQSLSEDTALHSALQQIPCALQLSTDGEEALFLVTVQKPELVLLELPSPGMDTVELCSQLCGALGISVIGIVGSGDEAEQARAWSAGLIDCTERPQSNELLAHRVRVRLHEAGLRTAIEQQTSKLEGFAHNVAHDIKNPLSTLLGCSETLLDVESPFGPEDQLEMIGIIDEAGLRMNNIVDELLVVNSLRSQRSQFEVVDGMGAMQGALRRCKAYLRDISAEVYAPDSLPSVYGQSQWVEEIWKTLLCKAIQCAQIPLQIILEQTEAVEGLVAFQIVYNGTENHGDNPENHFETPFDLNALRTKGRGLGLPAVRYMTEAMGGYVSQERFEDGRWRLYFAIPEARA